MSEKLGCLIVDLEGTDLTALEKEMLMHPLVGGVILFKRNYVSRAQLQQLCRAIRAVNQKPRLIMVDQEGGPVQRFIDEFTRIPAMSLLGAYFDKDPHAACAFAKDCAWLMAYELLASGIDFTLAPVLDLNSNKNSVIGQRAFHASPEVVIDLAQAFVEGLHAAGMASVGKHFPGHGSVGIDSHYALPEDTRSFKQILTSDLIPFIGLIKHPICAMMSAHIVFPKVDAMPVSYSRMWLQKILREQLTFSGCIFSDDLNMEGANISLNYADRVNAAREAGCDFTLLCNNRKGVLEALDQVNSQQHVVHETHWKQLQGQFNAQLSTSSQHHRWQILQKKINEFSKETHAKAT